MDQRDFDELTRSVASGSGPRRAMLRWLAGGALAGVAVRLGLDGVAMGNEKKSKRKRRQDKDPQQTVQAEGKRKKNRGKDRDQKRDKKRQRDQDDPPQPLLPPCAPGEKLCTGYTECFAENDCCPNAVPPLCDACQKVVCENGGLVCKNRAEPDCSACQEKVCENGAWVCKPGRQEYCPAPNWVWDFNTCRCVCTEEYVDCGVYWDGYRWVGRCSCELAGGRNYCDEERGLCCSYQDGCDF